MADLRSPSLDGAIISDADGSLLGESGLDLQRAVDAGVLYVCPLADGTCPNGQHWGGPFLHYCDGMDDEDYDRATSDDGTLSVPWDRVRTLIEMGNRLADTLEEIDTTHPVLDAWDKARYRCLPETLRASP